MLLSPFFSFVFVFTLNPSSAMQIDLLRRQERAFASARSHSEREAANLAQVADDMCRFFRYFPLCFCVEVVW